VAHQAIRYSRQVIRSLGDFSLQRESDVIQSQLATSLPSLTAWGHLNPVIDDGNPIESNSLLNELTDRHNQDQ